MYSYTEDNLWYRHTYDRWRELQGLIDYTHNTKGTPL